MSSEWIIPAVLTGWLIGMAVSIVWQGMQSRAEHNRRKGLPPCRNYRAPFRWNFRDPHARMR